MDPTSAIITALVAGAAAAAKDSASDAVKVLYKSLKDLLSKHLLSLPLLEKSPTDAAQRAAAEELSGSALKDDPNVARAAAELAGAVVRDAEPGTLSAVMLAHLKVAGDILVRGNVGGVIAENIEAGSLTIEGNTRGN